MKQLLILPALLVGTIGTLVGLEIPLLLHILKERFEFKDLIANVLFLDYIGALAASMGRTVSATNGVVTRTTAVLTTVSPSGRKSTRFTSSTVILRHQNTCPSPIRNATPTASGSVHVL